jgi:dTMP kinase
MVGNIKKSVKSSKKSVPEKEKAVKISDYIPKKRMNKGLFIVFDGIDGSGKSTIMVKMNEYLKGLGYDVVTTHQPSSSRYGLEIKEVVRKKKDISKEELLKLFKLDLQDNVAHEILPAVDKKRIVLCDRYYHSTLAYQLEIEEWPKFLESVIKPDLILIFDVSITLGLTRITQKYPEEKRTIFETPEMLEKARQKFILMPHYLEENIKIVDASKTFSEVLAKVKEEVMRIVEKEAKEKK